ncbi:hypothetical protein HGRIS_010450 [Hohenbuehelia grisea]|uniref:Uncharacterized protein n=1 Tax=Hohenbuehelia grisea TaxID=104357 RepID=A0ABR3IZ89_9AGAR
MLRCSNLNRAEKKDNSLTLRKGRPHQRRNRVNDGSLFENVQLLPLPVLRPTKPNTTATTPPSANPMGPARFRSSQFAACAATPSLPHASLVTGAPPSSCTPVEEPVRAYKHLPPWALRCRQELSSRASPSHRASPPSLPNLASKISLTWPSGKR